MATSLSSLLGSLGLGGLGGLGTGGLGAGTGGLSGIGTTGSGSVDPGSMVNFSQEQTDISSQISDAMMGQLAQASMDQLKQTMLTGQLKTVTSLGEGIAKTFKAMGDAVKGLC